ncbi:hypothetical protein SKAU_G00311860 [Synaphobranchus kaupii]|uniref:Uncharacterized protein n=1 Tax=Synaphobranchus kaupii TaxID=118154 RepID=A0A9Q1ILB6_SYNKA|nr:hypothetical protein SKAU_G00311860 [Synaphobranchus kaupii]
MPEGTGHLWDVTGFKEADSGKYAVVAFVSARSVETVCRLHLPVYSSRTRKNNSESIVHWPDLQTRKVERYLTASTCLSQSCAARQFYREILQKQRVAMATAAQQEVAPETQQEVGLPKCRWRRSGLESPSSYCHLLFPPPPL